MHPKSRPAVGKHWALDGHLYIYNWCYRSLWFNGNCATSRGTKTMTHGFAEEFRIKFSATKSNLPSPSVATCVDLRSAMSVLEALVLNTAQQ